MPLSPTNKKVDNYLMNGCGRCELAGTPQCKVNNWLPELELLREFALESGLTEELKWGVPCYTYNDQNVFLIHFFKEYCALLFMKGALMKDPKKLLIQQTENVQSGRQMRFKDLKEITKLKATVKQYIKEAIAVEKSGLKVEFKKTTEYSIPEELQDKFKKDPQFKKAFYALTPGRQRGYLLFFSAPKQSKTREARIEKYTELIFKGKGYQDR